MTYPGQTVTFNDTSYDNPSNSNCLNIDKEYYESWVYTVELENLENVVLFNHYTDPFNIYGSVISVTTELYSMTETNEKVTYGMFGIHFNTTLFAQTIDPLLENRQRNYVDGTSYFVYPVR